MIYRRPFSIRGRKFPFMKKHYFLFILIFLFHYCPAQVSPPDFTKIKDYEARMESMKKYGDLLMGSDSAIAENYAEGIHHGLSGLSTCKKEDAKFRTYFASIAGLSYYNQMKFDSAIHYFNIAYKESKAASLSEQFVGAANALMALNLQRQNLPLADSLKNEILAVLDTARDEKTLFKGYNGLGNYYYIKSYYTTAQQYILKSLEINKKMADTAKDNRFRRDMAAQYYNLYKIYTNTHLYTNALRALQQGSRYRQSSPTMLRRYYSAFIDAFTTPPIDHIDSALKFYGYLNEFVSNAGMGVPSELVTSNIVLGQYYCNKSQYDKALPFILKSEEYANESKSPFLIHQVQNILGRYRYFTGDYDEAIDLLSRSAEISRNITKGNYVECMNYIALAYKAKGNPAKALEYYELYSAAKDSLNKENMNRSYADMEVRYQTREKEQQITVLNNDKKVRELELKNGKRLRLLLVSGLVALGIIALLLYRIYLQKEKANKALNEQNEQLDQLNAQLAKANENKAKLFGIFSHDLRAPVSKIAQFLRLQKESPDLFNEQEQASYNERFTQTTGNLLNTMEDLLLWSKSQMEKFQPEFFGINIKEQAEKEIGIVNNLIEEKNLEINNSIDPSFRPLTDENFVRIILRNLLQNAAKYSIKGGLISLRSSGNKLYITNRTDKSTDAAILNTLLDKGEINSNYSGLGLQIAKDLCDRIGIKLYFEQTEAARITAILQWEEVSNPPGINAGARSEHLS